MPIQSLQEQYLSGLEKDRVGGGTDYDFYNSLFRDILSKGDPNQALYRQNLQGTINSQFNQSQQRLRENLAGSGMLRSGAALSGFMGLEGGRSQALAGAEVNLAQQDQDYRDKAITRLLGLEQMKTGEFQSNRDYAYRLRGLAENQRQFDQQLAFEKYKYEDSQPSWLGTLLGGIGGAFGGSYLGALGSKLGGK